MVDTVLISSRLQAAGYAPSVANAMYSSYGNLAVPLYNLVPALLAPITLSLVPTLTAALVSGDRERACTSFEGGFRLTVLIALPAALGLSVFSEPILALLYGGQETAIRVASPLLCLLAPALLPAVLVALTGAALQAANKAAVPVWSMLAGAVVKLALELLLLSMPGVGILGAPISTLACNLTVLAINVAVLTRTVRLRALPMGALLRPLCAASLSVFCGAFLWSLMLRASSRSVWQMPVVLLLVAALYACFALLIGAVKKEDIEALPGGEVLCRLFLKCNLLKEVENREQRRKITADFGKKRI